MLNDYETKVVKKVKVMIVGRDLTYRDQNREFDCICAEAKRAFSKMGYETILVHSNEAIIDIVEREKPIFAALQFGGKHALRFLNKLSEYHTKFIGLGRETASRVENKENFRRLITHLHLKQPRGLTISNHWDLDKMKENIAFPVIISSSITAGEREEELLDSFEALREKIATIMPAHFPVVVEEYLSSAIKCSIDVISDGEEVFIPLPLEHISMEKNAKGSYVMPSYRVAKATLHEIYQQVTVIARFLNIKGIFNIQFSVKGEHIYVMGMHCGASPSIPLISKLTGMPLIEIAIKCMFGESLKEQRCLTPLQFPFYCVKEPCVVIPQIAPKERGGSGNRAHAL